MTHIKKLFLTFSLLVAQSAFGMDDGDWQKIRQPEEQRPFSSKDRIIPIRYDENYQNIRKSDAESKIENSAVIKLWEKEMDKARLNNRIQWIEFGQDNRITIFAFDPQPKPTCDVLVIIQDAYELLKAKISNRK